MMVTSAASVSSPSPVEANPGAYSRACGCEEEKTKTWSTPTPCFLEAVCYIFIFHTDYDIGSNH
jgi:hypothetical protein